MTHAPDVPTRAILQFAPFNVAAALLIIGAGVAGGTGRWVLWGAAGLAIVATSFARRERGFTLGVGHFVERHGLVVLIALGESVVSIGVGAEGLPVRPPLVLTAALGFALAAALWWSYFDRDDVRAEHAMQRANSERRAYLAIRAYWHAHLVMISGIVLASAGMQEVVRRQHAPTSAGSAWLLATGIAVYLSGDALFRHLLGVGRGASRLTAAVVAAGTAPVGTTFGGSAQLGVLVAVLVAALVAERRAEAS